MEENKNNLKDQIDIALSKTNKNYNNKKLIDKSFSSALSRIATELLAGLIVGAGIGLMMDNWLNTKPLFLIVFFILGGIAGIYNLWRQLNGQGLKLGYFNKEKRN
tara:strand:- start:493 stop:807 length:315 start_codon:yes stop_codon:yes gene_type:complete